MSKFSLIKFKKNNAEKYDKLKLNLPKIVASRNNLYY